MGYPPQPPHPSPPGARLLVEMYADELLEHASGITSIHGLSHKEVHEYKHRCKEAARLLRENAALLRSHGFGVCPTIKRRRRRFFDWGFWISVSFIWGATIAATLLYFGV